MKKTSFYLVIFFTRFVNFFNVWILPLQKRYSLGGARLSRDLPAVVVVAAALLGGLADDVAGGGREGGNSDIGHP